MPIAKNQRGLKRVCENCNCRWYDLNKKPIICPKCNQEFEINSSNFINLLNVQNNKQQKSDLKVENTVPSEEDASLNDNNEDEDNNLISLEDIEEEEVS